MGQMNFEKAFRQLYKSYVRTISSVEMQKETLERTIDDFSDFLIVCYPDGTVVRGNAAASKLFGRPTAEIGGERFQSLFSESQVGFITSFMERVQTSGQSRSEMVETHGKFDSASKYVYWTIQKTSFGGALKTDVLVILGKDQTKLISAQNQISNLLSCIPVGLLTMTPEGKVLGPISDYARRLLQLSADEVNEPCSFMRLIADEDARVKFLETLKKASSSDQDFYSLIDELPSEVIISDSSGEANWISLTYHPVPGPVRFDRIVLVMQNCTNIKRAEEEVSRVKVLARTDALTGVRNRAALNEDLLSVSLKLKDPASETNSIAILMIDVDHFKLFNDSLGHLEGDRCLRQIGHLLAEICTGGQFEAYRYGGEEFCLLLENSDTSSAIHTATSIQERLREAAVAHPRSTASDLVTVSIGISCVTQGEVQGFEPEMLIDAADKALYSAKHAGRNRYSVEQCVVRQR